MSCKQLGGACNQEFQAETFEEMAEQSKAHAIEMFQNGDEDHLAAMKAMQKWMDDKRRIFNAL